MCTFSTKWSKSKKLKNGSNKTWRVLTFLDCYWCDRFSGTDVCFGWNVFSLMLCCPIDCRVLWPCPPIQHLVAIVAADSDCFCPIPAKFSPPMHQVNSTCLLSVFFFSISIKCFFFFKYNILEFSPRKYHVLTLTRANTFCLCSFLCIISMYFLFWNSPLFSTGNCNIKK